MPVYQHDFDVANQTFPAFRADLNNALKALAQNSMGTAAPSPTFPLMWWPDTTANLLKIRNIANTAWVTIGTLDVTRLGFDAVYAALAGSAAQVFSVANAAARTQALAAGQAQDNAVCAATDTGAANAIAVSLTPAVTTRVDKMLVWVRAIAANTGATTFNLQALGAQSVVEVDGTALVAGRIKANAIIGLAYELANTRWQLVAGGNASAVDAAGPALVFNLLKLF